MPAREPERFAPVFVLAPPRSYSSVVTTMIGQHPDLAGSARTEAVRLTARSPRWQASLPRYWRRARVHPPQPWPGARRLAQFEFGDQEPDKPRNARALAQGSAALVGRTCPRRAARPARLRASAVEKSPENVATAVALRRLAPAPTRDARYLHLTRHPVTTQCLDGRAPQAHRAVASARRPADGRHRRVASRARSHRALPRTAAASSGSCACGRRTCSTIRSGSSRRSPIGSGCAPTAKRLRRCATPRSSPFARFGPEGSGVIGGHDPGFMRDPIPRAVELPHTVEQPAGWQGEARLWPRTVALARRLGYGEETMLVKALYRRDLRLSASGMFTLAWEDEACVIEMDCANTMRLRTVIKRGGAGFRGQSTQSTFRASRD